MAIVGFEEYNWVPFIKKKDAALKLGTPISYELDEKEIVDEWCKQICEMSGYENKNC